MAGRLPNMKNYKGKFITFEGSEGSGKSTQIDLISQYLKSLGKSIVLLREPGGVTISEKIREILLDVEHKEMGDEAETLLYMAARAQLVKEIIVPALKAGKIVLCDRFLDSTLVYQGYGHGMDMSFIKTVGKFVTQGISPNLTLLFDIDTKKGLSRINRAKDRIEQRALTYHNKVRNGYLDLARREPKRIKVIKVDKTKEEIHLIVRSYVDGLLCQSKSK